MTTAKEEEEQQDDDPTTITSFVDELSAKEVNELQSSLYEFLTNGPNNDNSSNNYYRPIALITSGGTCVDIDGGVRSLENFSTGKRGAVSVEQFLARGYVVIHLQRSGSCSPYARVVNEFLNNNNNENTGGGLTCESLGRLLALEGKGLDDDDDDDVDDEEELVRKVLEEDRRQRDPFLTNPTTSPPSTYYAGSNNSNKAPRNNHHHQQQQSYHSYNSATTSDGDIYGNNNNNDDNDEIKLRRLVANSGRIRNALRDRHTAVVKEKRLLAVEFRTVQQYLAKLQIVCETVRDCCNVHCLAMVYLAAAVSDFYVPSDKIPEHKIQSSTSSNESNSDGLTLQLRNVPKMLGLLRSRWIPDAFVVSFKLETDTSLLRSKSERAVSKYGSHLVVGNILKTRYQKVYVLSPPQDNNNYKDPEDPTKWEMVEIANPSSSSDHRYGGGGGSNEQDIDDPDALESAIVDYVVQSHFEYISYNYKPPMATPNANTDNNSTVIRNAAQHAAQRMREKKRSVQRDALYAKIKNVCFEVLGAVIAVGLSYVINTTLQQRLRR